MTRATPPPSPTTWATTWATWPAWAPTCSSSYVGSDSSATMVLGREVASPASTQLKPTAWSWAPSCCRWCMAGLRHRGLDPWVVLLVQGQGGRQPTEGSQHRRVRSGGACHGHRVVLHHHVRCCRPASSLLTGHDAHRRHVHRTRRWACSYAVVIGLIVPARMIGHRHRVLHGHGHSDAGHQASRGRQSSTGHGDQHHRRPGRRDVLDGASRFIILAAGDHLRVPVCGLVRHRDCGAGRHALRRPAIQLAVDAYGPICGQRRWHRRDEPTCRRR